MRNELEVMITVGCPAAGKTTFRKEFLSKSPGWVAVSRDDFRYMLRNQGWCTPKVEALITELVNHAILNALANRLNVLVDATNLKAETIKSLTELVHEYANVSFQVFDVPYETLLDRDSKRERSVGKDVIDRMWKNWVTLKDSFDFSPIKKSRKRSFLNPRFDSELPDAVMFDIDGTLANMGTRSPYDWKSVGNDSLNRIVAEHVEFHRNSGRKIIVVSGRDSECREITEEWLASNGVVYDMLFMRPEKNVEKDTAIKKRIYDEEIKDKYNVLAVYDDRLSVCKMWYEHGLFVFNVNQGLKPF